MIKNLSKTLILFFLSITFICNAKEEVLFTVNNNPITSIDLNQRIFYLSILNDFDINSINKKEYINDLISVKLFDEFSIKKNLNIEIDEIENYFDAIFTKNKINIENLFNEKKITKDLFLKNIQYDLQRKKIIEFILDEKFNNFNLVDNKYDILDIYQININYFIFASKYKEEAKIINERLLNENINSITKSLNASGIEFEFFSRKIINLDSVDNKIKNIILSNKNNFLIEEKNYIMTGTIKKKLKTDIDLKYSFVQIIPNQNIDIDSITNKEINCDNIESSKTEDRFIIKEYKSINLKDLNSEIFQYLSRPNERLIIKNNNKKYIILLCEINYNEKMANDKIFQNKIQKIAKEIEIEFIKTKKKEFNFQSFY